MSSSAAFAQHAPLIRDYPGAPAPAPAPPDPPEPPQPPKAEPIAFSAVAKASLFGIIGSAISTTTLATITCADSAMTISLSETVAGLTFSYSSGVLSVAGTPTGTTRRQRVMVSYVASDGSNTIRGSTSHDITLVKATEVLTIGSMAGASGKVGRPLTAALASPSANYNVAVTAHASALVPGCAVSLDWTPGATSSGTLTLEGTPTQSGTYVLTVNYRSGGLELGTSTHQVLVAAAYENPAPDPSPGSGPTPIVPSDPGPVTPTPTPGLGPDPTLTGVRVLMRFDTLDDIAKDERGNGMTNSGATLTTGAVGNGAAFTGALTTIYGTVPGLDGVAAGLSVECMADIGATAWASLTAAGADQRFCPVVSYTGTDGALLWALGYLSRMVDVGIPGTTPYRRVDAMFWTALDNAYSPTGSGSAGSGGVTARPARFVHLAGVLKTYTALSWERASWLAGGFCISRLQGLQSAPIARSTGVLKIGGACPAFNTYDNPAPLTTIVPFTGVVDELRIKAPGQYADLMNSGVADAITPARRVIPWPNY